MYSLGLVLTFFLLSFILLANPTNVVAQTGNGFLSNKIVCQTLVLVKKLSDDRIVCVKTDTADKLVKRGWASIINVNNNTFSKPVFIIISREYNIPANDGNMIENQTASKYPFLINMFKQADYVFKQNSKIPNGCDSCGNAAIRNPSISISSDLANLMVNDPSFHFIKASEQTYTTTDKIGDNIYLVVIVQ